MKLNPLLSLRSIVDLASANLFSLLMNIITIPVIAYFYNPDDYGLYALLLASATLGGIIVTFKLEAEVVKAKSLEKMVQIVAIIIINALTCMGILLVLISVFNSWIDFDKRLVYAGLAMTLSRVLWDTSYSYLLWKGDVSKLRFAKIVYSLSLTLGFVAFSNLDFYGLLISFLIASITVLLVLPIMSIKILISQFLSITELFITFRSLIWKSSFLTFSTLLSIVSMEMPVFVFSGFYTIQEAGIFSLSYKMAVVPVVLVAASTSDLFFSWSNGKSKLQIGSIARQLPAKLIMYSPVFLSAYFLVVFITLSFLKIEDWEEVPVMFLMLFSWILLTLATNPIVNSFAIMDRQRDSAVIQIIILILRLLVAAIAILFELSAISFLILFVFASTLGRIILLLGIQRIFKNGNKYRWKYDVQLFLAGLLSIYSIAHLLVIGDDFEDIIVALSALLIAMVLQLSSKIFRKELFAFIGGGFK